MVPFRVYHSLPSPPPSLCLSLRMSDLYRHMRQQSRLGSLATPTTDEDPTRGAWPTVARGKKGDILKLVQRDETNVCVCAIILALITVTLVGDMLNDRTKQWSTVQELSFRVLLVLPHPHQMYIHTYIHTNVAIMDKS